MNLEPKSPQYSCTEQVHLVNSGDLNGWKRLFGGSLLAWIDVVASIAARRHCGTTTTTAAIDTLNFIKPAYAGDIVVISAKLTYTGRTSMEVHVCSYVESNDGSRSLINEAYVVMVALDENDRPCPVPPLLPETDEEIAGFEAGKRRSALRKTRREENF